MVFCQPANGFSTELSAVNICGDAYIDFLLFEFIIKLKIKGFGGSFMIYHDFQGLKLSALGLGCMRLPTVDGQDTVIDEEATAQMVQYALNNGINYFDTAWFYHGGNSETVMGKVLHRHPRDSFYLASKFPGSSIENMRRIQEIFEKQLEKCQVEYFDFYLFHNVAEKNIDGYMDENLGVFRYLMEQKRQGRIHHLGFSTHGSIATMRRFLEAYGEDMEFCQIQLNYLDWNLQNAKTKVELIREWGLPIWVMEPVRGGRLAKLPDEDNAKLNALRPGVEAPEWAFRFLQGIDGVTMVLSGMSNFQQLQDNIRTFQTSAPLNDHELNLLMEIAGEMIRKNDIPCTGCSYCTDRCPQGLPIPAFIKLYNELANGAAPIPTDPGPADCLGCRSCESVCPQGIMISEVMAAFPKKC